MNSLKKRTACIHAGGYFDEQVGGVTTPIYTSSSYKYREGGICYPRNYNIPTQRAAAEKIAALEHGEVGLILASGMAAISSVMMGFLSTGDHAVIQSDIYGGTYHFIEADFERYGIEATLVRGGTREDFTAALRDNTKVVYFETPTNPLLKIVDIRMVADLAREAGAVSIIDNTFATPIVQTPLDLGVDVVLHSGTKYLGGHSDLQSGAVVTSKALMPKIRETAVNYGAVLSPYDCYLLERSMKTLALRMAQHNENGLRLAEFLQDHPKVKAVNYPGLPGHPGHEIAARQMSGFGGMLSIDLGGTHEQARAIVDRLKFFAHAISLGGVESLVSFPVLTSHAKVPAEERAIVGITDTLVRLSVGIEDPEDLIEDWKTALGG